MGLNKPAPGRWTSRRTKSLRKWLDRLGKPNYRGLHLEPLEERRLLTTTPHSLASSDFSQDWSNPDLIITSDNWDRVPSIMGYAGTNLATPGFNPAMITAEQTTVAVRNEASLGNNSQAIGEHNPFGTIGIQGTDNAAPSLVLHLNTTGRSSINVSYKLRDIEVTDDAVQSVALQYRVGSSGNFINLPSGFVADATTGGAATLETNVSVTLPVAADNKPLVQVRIITADAIGADEWVGVDNIVVTSSTLVTTPSVFISDEALPESDGERLFTLPLLLSSVATSDVVIHYQTADGTAIANEDYEPRNSSVTISAGSISTTISLIIKGDTIPEPDESYFVNITGVTGGIVGDGTAVVTILNDDVAVPTTTSVGIDGAGNLTLVDIAGASNDTLTIQSDTVNGRFVITDPNNLLETTILGATGNGTNSITVPFAAVTGTQILIDTLDGDDAVTLDYSLGGFGKPIQFNGGVGGNDGLRFVGSGTQSAVYQPSATTFGSGLVTVDGASVNFSNLEPMDFTGLATFTLALPGAADIVNVDNAFDFLTGTTPALRLSGLSGGVPFEAAHVFGNTTVVIDTAAVADGGDLVLVNSANNAHNNTNLTIQTGAGADNAILGGAVALAGNLSITSGSIVVGAPINTDMTANAGSVRLIGSLAVTVAGNIDTDAAASDGNVLVAGSDVLLASPIAAGDGTVRLLANGGISQSPAGVITAASLGVRNDNAAVGSIDLSQANDVDTFAAFSAHGGSFALSFVDSDGLSVGAVAADGPFAATSGAMLGVSGEVLLQAGGALALNAPITAGAGGIALVANGDISQSASGLVTGGLVAVRNNNAAAGNVALTQNNDVGTIAGFNASPGTFTFSDIDDLMVSATPSAVIGSLSVPAMSGIQAAGSITVTTIDSAAAGQNLSVAAGVSVRSSAGNVNLRAGDNLSLPAASAARSDAGTVSLSGDFGNADAGVGATVDVAANTLIASLGANIAGGGDSDVFNVIPSTQAAISVQGNAPVSPTLPGDQLNIDLTAVLSPSLQVTGAGAGTFMFGGGLQALAYASIETLNAVGAQFDLVIDMGPAGLNRQDGVADTITAQLNAAGTMLEVSVSGLGLVFSGDTTDIRSLSVLGSTDADTLVIQESTGNLLLGEGGGFSGSSPFGHVNGSLINSGRAPSIAAVHFDGGSGAAIDTLRMNFNSLQNVAFFSDAVDTANSGNVNVLGAFTLSFESLTPMIFSGAGGPLLIDASSTPATTQLAVSDDLANTAGAGGNMVTGNGGFETTFFRGFINVTVRGGGGAAETITLASLDPASTETSITLDGDDLTNTDASADTLIVQSLPATVTATLLGGAGDDQFLLDSNGAAAGGTVDNLLGQVIISPAGDEGGFDTLTITDDGDATGDAVSLNTTQIDGITGFAGVDIVYTNVDTVNLNSGSGGDTLNVTATLAGVLYNVNTQGGGDTINFSSTAPLLIGTLDNIDGQINLSTGAGSDTLNVSDAGDANGDTYFLLTVGLTTRLLFTDGTAVTDLVYDAVGGAGQLEFFNLTTSDTAGDALNIDNTTATSATVISSGGGDDGWAILAHNLIANNSFNGNAGSDSFFFTLAAGQSITAASLVVNGNDPAGDTLPNQDIVTLAVLGTRTVGFNYQSAGSGDVNVTGLGTVIDINTIERLEYLGQGGDDDALSVTGVAGIDDDLSVIPTGAGSAQIFRGGDPFDGPPETPATSRPGSLNGPGASFGPDLSLSGAASLTISGGTAGAAGNRLYVYGQSEGNLVNSNGVTYVPGVADARDVINVTDSQVAINNATLGALLPVNIAAASFVQTDPTRRALIVNAGDEAIPGPGGIADDITVLLSSLLSIQINGGNPLPGLAPNGDRLNVITPLDVNVFSDKNSPANVTITSGGTLELGFSSIERTLITPGSGVVNLLGDNNDSAVDQNDNFVVVGADIDGNPLDGGMGEFALSINGSAPLFFDNVQFLNVLGDDAALTPSVGPNDIDTLELTPYADNTPRGWGVQVSFNEGNPVGTDGAQADLLIYNTVVAHAVSEDIVVQPSELEAGELRVTNATDGSAIVTVSYINNLDIIVNDNDGFLSDTDSLTLRGTDPGGPTTTGDESVIVDLTAAGTPAAPWVIVNQVGGVGGTLYRLRSFANFNQLNIETLGGGDLVNVLAGRNDGSVAINIDGGQPGGSGGAGQIDTVAVAGTLGAADTFRVTPGASSDAGRIEVLRSTASAETVINFVASERVEISGQAGAGNDVVILDGTGGDDVFTLNGTGTLAGTARVNAGPEIVFSALGTGGSDLALIGLGGDDAFAVTHIANWQIDNLAIDGGPPSASDTVQISGTGGDDSFAYSASSVNSGQIDLTSGGSTTNYILSQIESASIDGLSQAAADSLNVTTDNATIVPGAPGAGMVHPVSAGGAALLALQYTGIESALATGNAAVIEGTSANDTIQVSAAGIVTITNLLGFNTTVDASGFASLVINGLAGDDAITIAAGALFAGGIRVIGGEPGAGSDSLNVTGTAGNDNIVVDLATSQVSGVVGGPIDLDGIEHLTIEGAGAGAGDNIDVDNFGAPSSLATIQINANNLADTLDVTGTAGPDVINFIAASAAAGMISRTGTATTINYSSLTGAVTIAGGAGGFDVLAVWGTEGADAVSTTATTVTLNGTVTLGAGIDRLEINTLGGSDNVTLTGLTLPTIVDAGAGNDTVSSATLTIGATLLGGSGDDNLTGGLSADRIEGGSGNDTLNGGAGNDVILGGDDFDIVDPGTGIDDVDGGAGSDDWLLVTSTASAIEVRESAGRLRVGHGGNVVLASDISQAIITSNGAAVTMTVLDLTGTNVERVGVDFNDGGSASTLVVNGTAAADNIGLALEVTNPGGNLLPHVTLDWGSVVAGTMSALQGDRITIRALGGNDTVVAAQSVMDGSGTGSALITLDGGDGNDALTANTPAGQTGNMLIGGAGNDLLEGGSGNDEMDGSGGDDSFLGNGGVDRVGGGTIATVGDALLVPGTAGNDAIELALNGAGHLLVTINGVTTTYTNFIGGPFATAGIERILVDSGDGNDTLTVNSANGAISVAISFDGGAASDGLVLSGGTATSNIYAVGPNPGQGISTIVIGGVTQSVTFTGLEPVVDLVAGPLAVVATPADNAINYSQGSVAANGLITVDNFESIEFSNKTILTIEAGAGNDVIHLNHPGTPTSLTSIVIDAGDPADDDHLVVNGLAGIIDNFLVNPTGADSGTVSKLGGPQPTVTFSGIEQLAVVGQSTDLDTLQYTATAGNDTLHYTPGATSDSGSIAGFASTVAPFGFVPTTFTGIRSSVFLGSGGGNGIVGGVDTLVINGTSADDLFSIPDPSAAPANPSVMVNTSATPHTPVLFNAGGGTASVVLRGLAGNDRFDLDFNPLLAAPGVAIRVEAGDGTDTINHTANTDAATTIDLAAGSIVSTGANPVAFAGVETINQISSGPAAALSISATGNDDQLNYTPITSTSGSVALESNGLTIHFSGLAGAFNLLGAGGSDTVTVNGNAAANSIAVSGTLVAVDALKAVTVTAESLRVLGLAGSDIFNVTPGATPIFIDGGDPIGALPGDQLNIVSGGGLVNFQAGPENDEGSIVVGALQPISFDHVESIGPIVGSPVATINGTGSDDSITIIARDASFHALANGVQDFTVQVNDGPVLLFIDTPVIAVNAMAGSDEIAVQAPAPNLAVWDVDITIDGGLPTGSDTVIFGTPGADIVQYTPTGADAGTLNVVNLASVTNLAGVEHLIYDGEGGNDALTIVGTAASDTIVHTPGSAADEGALRVNSLLGIAYQNLGLAAVVNIDGGLAADSLVVDGTDGGDQFNVNGNAIDLVTSLTINHVDLVQTGVESLLLNGLAGDDSFAIGSSALYSGGIQILGGDSSGSDSVTVTGTAGADSITLTLGVLSDTVAGVVAGPVILEGAELLTFNTLAGNDTISVANIGGPTNLGLITLNSGGDAADTIALVGGAGPDAIFVTPLSPTSVSATAGAGPAIVANLAAAATSTFTVAGGIGTDSVTVQGTSGSDTISVTRGATTNVLVNASKQIAVVSATTETLNVAAGSGSDTINISGAGGPALAVDGGQPDAGDLLNIANTGSGTTTVSPGATVDAGVVTTPDGAVTFEAIELIQVAGTGAADTLTTQGTNGPDEIALQFLGGANRVWVDGRAVVSFFGFGTVNLDGRFGDDKFSVSPVGLVGITTINVVGGDPTASDELVVTGSTATETIVFTPTGVDAGMVTVGAAPAINFNTTEALVIDGAGGNDTLSVNAPATSDTIQVKPGSTIDSGSVQVNAFIAASFENLGTTGVLAIVDAGGSDTLVYEGSAGSDTFAKTGAGGIVLQTTAGTHVEVQPAGVEQITLAGLQGNDLANFTGTGAAVALAGLGSPLPSVSGGGLGIVNFSGVETLNLNAAASAVAVSTTGSDETLEISPTGASSATLSAGVSPLVYLAGAASLSVDTLGGDDLLKVRFTSNPETIDVDVPAGAIGVSVGGPLLGINFAGVDAIEVFGEQGNDTFNVTPGADIPVFVDGGDPIGTTAGDRIVIQGGLPSIFEPGPENDEGGFNFGPAAERVSFDHIEAVTIVNAPCVIVKGTGGDDDITIIARDASYIVPPDPVPAGLDGVQDFTVSVNDGLEILYINATMLYIDALAGDDDIVLRTPAPNGAVWDVDVFVAGGPPSAATGDQGDVFELETPGQQTVTFTPNGSDSGLIDIATLSTTITLGTFVDACPPLNYDSSPGGVEAFIYDGEGANDLLTVIGTGLDDTIVHTPGSAADEGTLRVNNLLAVTYQNLGLATTVTVDGGLGTDALVYQGTDANDQFTVSGSAIDLVTNLTNHLDLVQTGVESLLLNGFSGHDGFTINATTQYSAGVSVHGGDPSHADNVFLMGTAGSDTIALTLGAAADTVTGVVAGPISMVGVETLTVQSLGGDDALSVANLGDPTNLDIVNLIAGANAGDSLSLVGGSGPNTIVVTPDTSGSVAVHAGGISPMIMASLSSAATSTVTVSGGGGTDSVTVNGTSTDDTITVTRGATTSVSVSGSKRVDVISATTEALTVAAGLGDDTINVSGVGGPALSIDGGQPTASDLLNIVNTGAGTTTVAPGATVDAGVITTPDGAVSFSGVELINVQATAGADTLVTQGTNGADQFALQFLGAANRVWIDGRAVVSFSAFETVNLQGRFGDDKFSVAPVGLVGVTTINVAGGDPTASDELVVTGSVGTDLISFTPTAADAGTVAMTGAPTINFGTTEALVIDGTGGNDLLTVNAPVTSDTIHVQPGTVIDGGRVRVNALIEASFENLGSNGTLSIVDAGGSDTLVYDGTTANDNFTVNGGVIDLVTLAVNNHIDVSQTGVEALVLNAFDGDDQFTINATALYTGGITIWAGDPSASDSVTLVGTAAADAINVALNVLGDVVTGVVGGPIQLVDVEHLTVNSLAGNDALSLTELGGTTDLNSVTLNSGGDAIDTLLATATAGADAITVKPTSATSVTLSANGVGPLVTANLGAAVTSLLSVSGGAGSNDLVVEGSANADVIGINGTSVAIAGLKTVNFSGMSALTVNGHQGNDAFTVTPAPTLPIFVDGGDPIGVNLPGDSLSLLTGGNPLAFFAGPESDEGGFLVGANAEVSFDHIENIGPIVVGPGPALIVGTNGDDDITVIARDSISTPQFAGADGVQDFTVSVNQGPDILFLNAATLFVDALSGDDDVVVRAPAPNNIAWQVTVNVVGGPPSASDTLVFETPGNDTVIFTPTGSDTGVLRVDEAPLGPIADPNDSIINILSSFTIPFPALTYVSSPGGIEHLKYDGEGSADNLQIVGTINSDIIVHTPGLAGDEGTLRINNLLGLSYQNLGLAAPAIVVDGGMAGSDRLVYDGTDGNDAFSVAATGTVDLTNNAGNHVDVTTASIEALTLNALNGDDTFTINGSLALFTGGIIVAAGDPSGSDLATLNGTAAADAINLTLGAAGDLVSGVVGGIVNLIGVENLTLNSLSGNDAVNVFNVGAASDLDFVALNLGGEAADLLTASGTDNDDRIIYTPTSTAGGTFVSESGATVFTFTQGIAPTSTFTINALGAGGDEVVVQGTNSHDVITVDSPLRTVTVENSLGIGQKPVILGITVESVTAAGRLGNDTFLVIPSRRQPLGPADVPVGPGFTLPTNLLVNIDGGAPGASDALVIAGAGGATLASDLFVVINRGRESDEGVVRIFQDQPGVGNEPFQFPDISYTDVEVVSPVPFVNAVGDPNLLVLGADLYEQNEFRPNAAFLGSGSTLNVVNVSIFPNAFEHRFVQADQDYFRVVAQQTGTLDFQVYFKQLNEFLPGRGNLQIEVLDADGTVIAGAGPNFGTNDGAGDFSVDDERIRVPVIAGQTYYLRVFGLLNATVNAYSIAVLNEAPPVPFDIELDDFVAISSVTAGVSASQFNGGAGLSDIDGYYNGKFLTITSGPLTGQRALITTYIAATRTFIFAAGSFGATPLFGTTFLVESGDTGRSQFENTTRDNTPTIFLRLDDANFRNDLPGNGAPGAPPDEVIPIPFNPSTDPNSLVAGFRIAIFDETDTHNPVFLGFAQPVIGQSGVYMFTFVNPLIDGSHYISARVQMIDAATPTQRGFGGRSLSAEIVIDTGVPPIFFGAPVNNFDGLDPASDSGVPGFPATFVDRITSDTTPSLFGVAEANSIVRVYEDRNANGIVDLGDVFLGQSVAIPLDGTNQLPGGQWNLTTIVDLNNPAFFPKDGTRRLLATGEDLAGNVTAATSLNIFIDTQGPQITNVAIPTDPFFDLFDPKPSQDGATPLVFSLAIDVRDLPNRDTINFPGYLALIEQVAEQPGHYVVRGDKVGIVAVQSVQVVFGPDVNGLPATATIVLTFAAPLADDRYTLTISDTITDPANNALDGENNAIQPLETPDFPSGDGTPGGGFAARFTVDSRPEIGTYAGTRVYLDTNGNFVFDPTGINNDAVNHDIVYTFGSTSDQIFAGKFGPPPLTGRFFDQLAAYGQFGGSFRWLIDLNSDGVVDINTVQSFAVNGVAVAGNFDFNAFNGDEIGLFDGSSWYRDLNRNFVIEPGEGRIASTMQGYPIVGDFDGDGLDDLGTFNNNVFFFDLAANGLFGNADASVAFGFPGVSERPVAADMDQDGIDDIGLWVPGNLGQVDAQTTEWHFLVSNDRTLGDGFNDRVIGTVNTLNHTFTPVPFAADLFAQFGDEPAFPVVGNFDPPVGAPAVRSTSNDIVVVAVGAGSTPRVRVLDHETGHEKLNFLAFGAGFTGGVNVATGDVNGDGVLDIVAAAGPGGGPHVRIFDGRSGAQLGGPLGSFFAYNAGFGGGVNVASADINGDGKADIITAAGAGGGPHVRIFSGADGSLLGEYFAFNAGFGGGVNVAVGDVDGNGVPDIVAAAGPGGGPHVRVFSGATPHQIAGPLGSFFAYGAGFTGGVYVAAGDVNGDARADIVTGAGAGGGPHVAAFNAATGGYLSSFFAYAPHFTGGVRVATADLNRDGRADIVTGAGVTGGPHIRGFGGLTAQHVLDTMAFEASFTGGVFVAGALSRIGGSPLMAAGLSATVASGISESDLQRIAAAAIARWEASGLAPVQLDRLRGVEIQLADLPGARLGIAYDDAILIDTNAADHGWFVDATPEQDEEFLAGRAITDGAQQGIDLLTVLAHELGHVLGLEDLDLDLATQQLMADELATGLRRVPSAEQVDDVFASADWQ